jgi:hypothetical protein
MRARSRGVIEVDIRDVFWLSGYGGVAPQAAAGGLGPVCVGQRGFDRHGAPTAALTAQKGAKAAAAAEAKVAARAAEEDGGDSTSQAGGSSAGSSRGGLAGGLDGGGWLACGGLKKSELESEGRHGCRQVRREAKKK